MCEVAPRLVTRRPSQVRLGPPLSRMASPTTSRLPGTPRLCMVRRPHGRECPSDAPPQSPSPPSSQSPAALCSSSSPASLLRSPPPVAAQVAHSESGHDVPCTGTRVAGVEQAVPASASAPAPTPALVPAPAAEHSPAKAGRSSAPAVAIVVALPLSSCCCGRHPRYRDAREVHPRC